MTSPREGRVEAVGPMAAAGLKGAPGCKLGNRAGGVGRLILTFSLCVVLVGKFASPVQQDKLLFIIL